MQNSAKKHIHIIKRFAVWMLAVVLLAGVFPVMHARAESSGTVKVKLTRLGTPSDLSLSVNCSYVLSGNAKMNIPADSTLTLSASDGQITASMDGMKVYCGSNVQLLRCGSGNSGIKFKFPALSNVFCGDLYLSASGSKLNAILHIYIEDYLYGVVAHEMSNSYPLEALKAQSVAARNYVMKKMEACASQDYHVTDNDSDQVFKGYNGGDSRVIQAVNETAGQVLYAGSDVASCYYTASNGGQTESTGNAWDVSLSYSIVKDDHFDLENTSAKKASASIAKDAEGLNGELAQALLEGAADAIRAAGADESTAEITAVKAVVPCNPQYANPSRLYKTLRFDIELQAATLSGEDKITIDAQVDIPTYEGFEKWYSLSLNSGSNETIFVDDAGDAFRITFRRWGHGIGMSQRGAQTMASSYGKDHEFILDFYYPGTELKNIALTECGINSAVHVDGDPIAEGEVLRSTALRSLADASASVYAELAEGVKVKIYDVDENWAAVSVMDLAGFAALEDLSGAPEVSPAPTPEPTLNPSPTATAAPEPTTAPYLPILTPLATAAPTPDITMKPTAMPTPVPMPTVMDHPMPVSGPADMEDMLAAAGEICAVVKVSSGSRLTLRAGRSTSSEPLGYMENDAQVILIALDDEWAYIRDAFGREGFAARRYLYIPLE